MAVQTYAEQLEEVQAAIAKAQQSQEYEITTDGSSRRSKRGDLEALYAREKYLRGMVRRESNGRRGIGVNRVHPR